MPKVTVAGINIRVHPHHSPDIYRTLLEDAFNLRQEIHSRADQYILLQSIFPITKDAPMEGFYGKLARFSSIDPDQPWFNAITNETAKQEDLSEVKIPENLRPNYTGFHYAFFPKKHRFVYEQYNGETTLSPNIVMSYFRNLFSSESITSKYGEVDVNVMRDDNKINEILNLHTLKKLEFDIKRPNPDDLEEAENEFFERLNSQRIREQRIELYAVRGQSIEPNDDTKTLAKIAKDNGEVRGEGYDSDGEKKVLSTQKHPKLESGFYDPHTEVSPKQLVIALAQRLLQMPPHA